MANLAATEVSQRPGGERGRWLLPIYPTIMIGVFFLAPFVLIVAVSVAHQNPAGYYEPAFELTHFRRFLSSIFIDTALFSVGVAALVAVICLMLGFPFTYFITRLPRRSQVFWLVYILAQLSLSEVLIAFSWQVLLSKTAGVTNILVWLGLLEEPFSLYPGFGAVLLALTYLVLPFSVLILYPALSRLEPDVTEAARTLGASPLRTFFTVVVPVLRPAIVATGITMFVFTLGAVLVPQVLGRPSHWTLSVLITDQAIFQSNIPFAAALAIFLLVLSMSLVGMTMWINRRAEIKR
jgi:putative spermidine/putrescine transport system permease protein